MSHQIAPRVRVPVAAVSALLAALALLGFFYSSHVLGARRVLAAEDARAAAQPSTPVQHPNANPVLVELFTSEGCSDCPPADALLARLQQEQPVSGANIIALEEHVDYWDHLGWRDRFSSPDITTRQGEYTRRLHLDDNYTPQMIVDGADQFIGSDAAHALRSIAAAARTAKLPLTISPVALTSGRLTGTVSIASASVPRGAVLYSALVQSRSSTRVLRGENGGHTLQHVSAVLSLEKIGDARAASNSLSFAVSIPSGSDPANLAVVIFAQQPDQGLVLAAAVSGVVR